MSETFGQRLKRLREAKGWTQNELESTAIPYTYGGIVHDIEGDRDGITLKIAASTCFGLSKALGVSMDYLYAGVEPSRSCDVVCHESIAMTLAFNTPGKRIRQRRDELGWTLCQSIAAAIVHCPGGVGVSREEWALTESDYWVSWTIENIANSLGVTPEWILTGGEPKFSAKTPDAKWFKGFGDEPEIETFPSRDVEVINVEFHVERGYAKKVLEMIRTGRPIE